MARRSCGVEGGGVSIDVVVLGIGVGAACVALAMIDATLARIASAAERFVDACDRNEREARGE